MDVRTFSKLVKGMEQIKAEEHLYAMDYISYPHAKDTERRKMHKSWYKRAYPENFEKKVIKTSDLELI